MTVDDLHEREFAEGGIQMLPSVKEPPRENAFAEKVSNETSMIYKMLTSKNESYGNAALDPVRVFSSASPEEQILVRIDDKLSRIKRGKEFADEDTIQDLIGYLILLRIARRDAR